MTIEVRKSSKSTKCDTCGQGIKRGELYANDFVTVGWRQARNISAGKYHLKCAECYWHETVVKDEYIDAVAGVVGVQPVKESDYIEQRRQAIAEIERE